GDEVILPPYTFIACVNVVLQRGAMPVFADVDPETFQIDPERVRAAITERTRAIMPVHIGGSLVDMDSLREVAARRQIPIVEDACQAHLAEWRGRKAGTLGQIGCFSFQASKNLTSGEGGAIVVDDEQLWERCFAFHYQGVRPRSARQPATELPAGCKFTITEFQAAVLLAQLARLENQAQRRSENAEYLTNLLQQIPGILPARMYDGCTRNAYHLYMFRYQPEAFADLPRSLFLKALSAEGIPASSGYSPLNKQPIIDSTLRSRGFRRLFPEDQIEQWVERNRCPRNDALCDQAVWFSQRLLLADRQDMEQIAAAVRKIQQHAGALKRA
ncbi:MAG: DegT/DnrJ/EryC1/StrS family aminotransferase, partial [Pirellulaceae bacterium]